jgi:hypothetical protein
MAPTLNRIKLQANRRDRRLVRGRGVSNLL